MTREEICCALLYGPFREDGLPADFNTWLPRDALTASEMARERADQSIQECNYEKWLDTLVNPLWDKHPDKTFGEIAELLPEPEKMIVKDHLHHTFDWYALPFECRKEYRRRWHDQAEAALREMLTGEPRANGFSIMEVVRRTNIAREHQKAAVQYLEVLLNEGQSK